MTDPVYPAPPPESIDDLDPESATTDRRVAMVRSHRQGEGDPTAEVLLGNRPLVLRARCDHRLSGEATALDVADRLASLIDAYTIMATFSPFYTSAPAVGPVYLSPAGWREPFRRDARRRRSTWTPRSRRPPAAWEVHEGHSAPVGPRLHPRRNAGLAFQQEAVGDRFGR